MTIVQVPPLPPQSAITVRSEADCLALSWPRPRGIIRRLLGLSSAREELLLYRDRLVYRGSLHPNSWMPPGMVMKVLPAGAGGGPISVPRHTLGDVRLQRNEERVQLMVQYRLAWVEIGASLGEDDKAWLADVLRRWIAG